TGDRGSEHDRDEHEAAAARVDPSRAQHDGSSAADSPPESVSSPQLMPPPATRPIAQSLSTLIVTPPCVSLWPPTYWRMRPSPTQSASGTQSRFQAAFTLSYTASHAVLATFASDSQSST